MELEALGTGPLEDNDPIIMLQQLEDDTTNVELLFQRAEVFKKAASLFRIDNKVPEAERAELKGALFSFMLLPRWRRKPNGYGRFAPMIEMGGKAYPHTLAFTPEMLVVIQEELHRTSNPIHQALYADFSWDQRGRYPGPTIDSYEAVKVGIDAYLKTAEIDFQNEWNDQLADALDRASELALSIRERPLITRCIAECFKLAEQLVNERQHPAVRWAIAVLETVQAFGHDLTNLDHERIITLAEAGAAYYEAIGNRFLQRPFLDRLAFALRALGRVQEAQFALERSAETRLIEAGQAGSAIVRLALLSDALEAYQKLGDSARIDEIKQLLSKAGAASLGEMVTVSVGVRIPNEIADAWVNMLLSRDLHTALSILSTGRRFVPDMDAVRSEAVVRRREYPMQYLVSRFTLDSAGRTVETSASETDQVTASEADVYNWMLATSDWELGRVFERLVTEKGLTPKTLMEFFRNAPLFQQATLDVVDVGVHRYFDGDYVSALHILVPQLEDTFRDILPRLGISRISVQQGITRERPLDIVLKTPELRAVLGEDLAVFFERYLVSPTSENLRHRVAHGLLKLGDITPQQAHRVLLCYLYLANVAAQDPDGSKPVTQ